MHGPTPVSISGSCSAYLGVCYCHRVRRTPTSLDPSWVTFEDVFWVKITPFVKLLIPLPLVVLVLWVHVEFDANSASKSFFRFWSKHCTNVPRHHKVKFNRLETPNSLNEKLSQWKTPALVHRTYEERAKARKYPNEARAVKLAPDFTELLFLHKCFHTGRKVTYQFELSTRASTLVPFETKEIEKKL